MSVDDWKDAKRSLSVVRRPPLLKLKYGSDLSLKAPIRLRLCGSSAEDLQCTPLRGSVAFGDPHLSVTAQPLRFDKNPITQAVASRMEVTPRGLSHRVSPLLVPIGVCLAQDEASELELPRGVSRTTQSRRVGSLRVAGLVGRMNCLVDDPRARGRLLGRWLTNALCANLSAGAVPLQRSVTIDVRPKPKSNANGVARKVMRKRIATEKQNSPDLHRPDKTSDANRQNEPSRPR